MLVDHMPRGSRWALLRGGLFMWVELDAAIDIYAPFQRALEAQVAFVLGHPFFVSPPQAPFMRLNYSHRAEADISLGVARLGRAIQQDPGRSRGRRSGSDPCTTRTS